MTEWATENPYLFFILLLALMFTATRIMAHYSYAKTARRNENTLEKLMQMSIQRKKMNQQQGNNKKEDKEVDF